MNCGNLNCVPTTFILMGDEIRAFLFQNAFWNYYY